MTLREKIENYIPFNEQEEKDKEYYLKFIDSFDDVLTRDNIFGHFTASAFVVNKERNKMLVVYHIIDDGWIYPGGHADGEEDLLLITDKGTIIRLSLEQISTLKRATQGVRLINLKENCSVANACSFRCCVSYGSR